MSLEERYKKDPYIPMDEEAIWPFLEDPSVRLMALATVGKDCKPSNSIIWFVAHDKKIYFQAFNDPVRKKTRDILNNPYVALTCDNGKDPADQCGVSIVGRARVLDKQEEIDGFLRLAAKKYQSAQMEERHPEARARVEAARVKKAHIYFEVAPERIFSFDRRKWLATALAEERSVMSGS